jgi:hypothetical protein
MHTHIYIYITCYLSICYLLFYRYNVQWYLASIKIQKSILFMLQRGNKIFGLKVGGMLFAFFECFASVRICNVSM